MSLLYSHATPQTFTGPRQFNLFSFNTMPDFSYSILLCLNPIYIIVITLTLHSWQSMFPSYFSNFHTSTFSVYAYLQYSTARLTQCYNLPFTWNESPFYLRSKNLTALFPLLSYPVVTLYFLFLFFIHLFILISDQGNLQLPYHPPSDCFASLNSSCSNRFIDH